MCLPQLNEKSLGKLHICRWLDYKTNVFLHFFSLFLTFYHFFSLFLTFETFLAKKSLLKTPPDLRPPWDTNTLQFSEPARPSCGFSFLCGWATYARSGFPCHSQRVREQALATSAAAPRAGSGELHHWLLQLLVLPVNNNLQFPRTLAHWQHDLQRRCNGYRLNWRQAFVLYGIAATVWFDKEQSGSQKDRWTNMCHGAFFCSRLQNKTPAFFSVSVALLAMVTQGEVLVVLVGEFMFRERPHTPLVPLLQACTTFGALSTHLQSHLDDTVRAVHRLGGAWRWAAAVCSFTFVLGHVPALPCAAATDRIMTSGSCQPSATSRPRWWTRWSFLRQHIPPGSQCPRLPNRGTCKLKSWKHAEGFWEVITSTFVLLS